ncbi:MAG: hypothetical protein LAT68_01880 [Cyclobacteriaceae bacterium]|nr:hypothetical protein [Cyclobacteriaceae bacterium]MCH8515052.1 hypothetical protein [Cyclobacteriaceae bacterium]
MKHFSFVFLCVGMTLQSALFAQESNEGLHYPTLGALVYTDKVSEHLFDERSVVLMDVKSEVKEGYLVRGNYQAIAERFHKVFMNNNVDAIAYYYLDDLFSCEKITASYLEDFKLRDIRNLIIIREEEDVDGKMNYAFLSTQMPKDYSSIASVGQSAYRLAHSELDQLLKNLHRELFFGEKEVENYLIINHPEYFHRTRLIKGRHFEEFNYDLKGQRLAIYLYDSIRAEDPKYAGIENIQEKVDRYNAEVSRKNNIIERVMQDYPFRWSKVPPHIEQQEVVARGYMYLVEKLQGEAHVIRDLLKYEDNQRGMTIPSWNFEDGKPVPRDMPSNSLVNKFYTKNLYTGDIYTSEVWDADESFEQALRNHVWMLRTKLKVPAPSDNNDTKSQAGL